MFIITETNQPDKTRQQSSGQISISFASSKGSKAMSNMP
jgi:hypothetical protein